MFPKYAVVRAGSKAQPPGPFFLAGVEITEDGVRLIQTAPLALPHCFPAGVFGEATTSRNPYFTGITRTLLPHISPFGGKADMPFCTANVRL